MKRSAMRALRCSANVKNVVATGRKTAVLDQDMARARAEWTTSTNVSARHSALSKASPNENFADVAAHLAVDDPAGQRLRYDVTCTGACKWATTRAALQRTPLYC